MKFGLVLSGILLCALVSTSSAQWIGIHSDPTGASKCVDPEAGQFLQLYIVVHESTGEPMSLSSVQFRLPEPWCGVGYWGWTPVFPLTYIGPEVVTVDFQGCMTLPQHVLTVEAFGSSHRDCCFITVEAVGATDCSGTEVGMAGGFYTLVDTLCQLIPPSNPYPADGAANVPRDVVLTWNEMEGPDFCADIKWHSVTFGTTPDPTFNTGFFSDTFWDPPGLLQENMTYYWRVTGMRAGSVSSPLWSFSTGAPVSVEQSTWGRIKALYRQNPREADPK